MYVVGGRDVQDKVVTSVLPVLHDGGVALQCMDTQEDTRWVREWSALRASLLMPTMTGMSGLAMVTTLDTK